MRDSLFLVVVWVPVVIAFFNAIIGVFGLGVAIAALVVFVALAGVLAARSQRSESRP